MKLEEFTSKKVGIVLSGGGIKGMAHIGVLEALSERGILPQIVSGASAGALIGALYAKDIAPEEMLRFFKNTPLFRYNFFTLYKPGLIDTERYRGFFEDYFPEDNFSELHRQLFVVATNLEKGESVIFEEGPLIKALLASAALPPVFSPVEIDNLHYTDGGVMNNFPVEPLVGKCDLIIGSYVTAMREVDRSGFSSSLQLTNRANLLLMHANCLPKLDIPDLLFIPEHLDRIGILDKKGIEQAYIMGYDHASRLLDKELVV
ncbi:patatin-like phospholipase family protein [Sungkyunkwania multivorans]|uniref:Patatin-like phospholipase family protein n=1 Tax=Sungkyunkwania multivorans TaxID=1173618 RepID=A0ABW3CUG1_9FLAO